MAKTSAALARASKTRKKPTPRAKKPAPLAKRRAPKALPIQPRPATAAVTVPTVTLTDVTHARTLFWQDCVRQMLIGLSMVQGEHPELFDGRTAILTHAGERIPIAEVFPLFACGLPTPDHAKTASIAVECTVFRVRTPTGEVFTLPVQEVRALHTLTPELIKEIEQNALAATTSETLGASGPFGFAAYTPRPSPAPAGPVDSAP